MPHRLALVCLLLAGRALAAPVEIRVATLAPKGSSWARIMEDGARALADKTSGRVTLKFYFGGQQGDERDVVRKMKLGQLDGAALTSVGLGLIRPDVLVLQLPYLFSSDAQVDFVRARMEPEFEKELEDAGYVLVSWGDVGWIHMFLTVDVKTPDDAKAVKYWEWVDDPIGRELLDLLGLDGVPLGIADVLGALQTGQIQACFGPPLGAVVLQWYTKIKYVTDRPSTYGIGAFLIRKEVFQALAPDDQALLRDAGHALGAQVADAVRRDNDRALKAMIASGVQVLHVPDDVQLLLMAAGRTLRTRLAGKIYSQAILDEVLAALAQAPQ